ncbi:MAG: GNAT family N-acetyltransferase [Clostridiaceae bacterium]|nr:GNAT family N-acetyltransferase [Clostridiaceae bacterium]
MENTKLDYEKFKQVFKKYLEDDRFFCFVAEHGGTVIGCLNLRIEYQLHHTAKIAEILELAVMDKYRSKGVGKELFDKASEIAKDNECLQIEVCCNQLRIRAHNFYEKQGMSKFHYKFSMNLYNEKIKENRIGI